MGNEESPGSTTWATVRKAGVTPIIGSTLAVLGSGPPNTSVVLASFNDGQIISEWSDGDSPVNGVTNSVVSGGIVPEQFDYPIGLGASFTALADIAPCVLEVYIQGFNADTLATASLRGGASSSQVVVPTKTHFGQAFASGEGHPWPKSASRIPHRRQPH